MCVPTCKARLPGLHHARKVHDDLQGISPLPLWIGMERRATAEGAGAGIQTTRARQKALTATEQRQLEQRMQKRQVKEFMGAFGGLVEHCFNSCVDDFTSKALSSRENGCINRCVLKWMATQQRVSERFQEHNAQITQQMQK
ncbi:mitochondrial import inner membrane translocase subunit tim9 [Purpureocillium lilacinum]|uniref:Mitochondrial import inner membrane translocase subunit n=1 Tax=Purpureocillium lilacinum TaxID=33203 RepID=A0A179HC88_PURLI|nr:mitochondrial import inner membrane translocase subunit tim9 [Purpureocillium lilacinum]